VEVVTEIDCLRVAESDLTVEQMTKDQLKWEDVEEIKG
jgi:hypothetical protein